MSAIKSGAYGNAPYFNSTKMILRAMRSIAKQSRALRALRNASAAREITCQFVFANPASAG